MQQQTHPFWKQYWPHLTLIALSAIFLGQAWFGQTMLLRDFFFGDESYRLLTGQALLHGRFPLWHSLSQCGVPFAASPYNSVFYPLTWLYALPSVHWAMLLDWTFHFSLCGIACYLLCRHWGLSIGSALFGAVSFAFCTFFVAWIEFSHGFHSVPWGVLGLYFVTRIIDRTKAEVDSKQPLRWGTLLRQNAISVAGLAVSLAMQIFSSTEFFYHFGLLVAVYGCALWGWYRSWKVAAISMLWIGLAGVLGACIAMPQMVLTLELMGLSVRSGETDAMLHMSSEHPWHWLAMLLPYLFGRPGYPNAYWAPTIYEFSLGTCYVGILPFIAAFFCWLKPDKEIPDAQARHWRFLKIFFACALAAGLILAAGKYTPIYAFLHHWLPGLNHLRFPVKFFCWVAFALSMLGALGFESVLACKKAAKNQRCAQAWWIAVGFVGIFALGYIVTLFSDSFAYWLMAKPQPPTIDQISAVWMDYSWAVVFSIAGLGLFGGLIFQKIPARIAQGGIVALAFVNLWIVSRNAQPWGPDKIYDERPLELAKKIGNDPMHRYFTPYWNAQQYIYGESRPEIWQWLANSGASCHGQLLGLSNVAVFQLPLERYSSVFYAMLQMPAMQQKLADMLAIKYVVEGQPFDKIYWKNAPLNLGLSEQKDCLPRAFIVHQWKAVSEGGSAIKTIADPAFNPHNEAVVETLRGASIPAVPEAAKYDPLESVQAFKDHGNSLSLEASVKDPALLVLSDTWYPGWKVTVDGVERPIFQTNYLFRGVFIEPGTHKVEFTYWPTHLTAALWICVLGMAAGASLLMIARPHLPGARISARQLAPK